VQREARGETKREGIKRNIQISIDPGLKHEKEPIQKKMAKKGEGTAPNKSSGGRGGGGGAD